MKQKTYWLHLPGVGGTRDIDTDMTAGLVAGHFDGDIRIYDWTENNPGLTALFADARNHRQAKSIATLITERFDADPTADLIISCHSGGAGLAVWALEDLPARVHVRDLLFMSPALSPKYDLSAALKHVTHRAYVFSSLDDQIVLGYGTRMMGTIDGVKTDAAGRIGFSFPSAGDPAQYAKLLSFPYQSKWWFLGNAGNHVGGMSHAFARQVLEPLMIQRKLPPGGTYTVTDLIP